MVISLVFIPVIVIITWDEISATKFENKSKINSEMPDSMNSEVSKNNIALNVVISILCALIVPIALFNYPFVLAVPFIIMPMVYNSIANIFAGKYKNTVKYFENKIGCLALLLLVSTIISVIFLSIVAMYSMFLTLFMALYNISKLRMLSKYNSSKNN